MIDVGRLKAHVYDVVGALYEVHNELGGGASEYCYQEALGIELSGRGIAYERERSFRPCYKGRELNAEYRVDFLCKGDIVVECKSVETILPVHRAQLFNYMRLLAVPCGILVNFFPKFASIERYFHDVDAHEILTVDGHCVGGKNCPSLSMLSLNPQTERQA